MLFSIFHYYGNLADLFQFNTFIIRFVAGIILCLIYIKRGIGITCFTHLSYDVSGSYFDLDMSLLEPGYAYGVKVAFYDDRNLSWREQPHTFKFRVEDYEY